jgi:hypothetical protein
MKCASNTARIWFEILVLLNFVLSDAKRFVELREADLLEAGVLLGLSKASSTVEEHTQIAGSTFASSFSTAIWFTLSRISVFNGFGGKSDWSSDGPLGSKLSRVVLAKSTSG